MSTAGSRYQVSTEHDAGEPGATMGPSVALCDAKSYKRTCGFRRTSPIRLDALTPGIPSVLCAIACAETWPIQGLYAVHCRTVAALG